MKIIKGGIDEAGLGPKLGPYCAFLTSFQWFDKSSPFELLKTVLSKNISDQQITVCDSKVLFDRTEKGMRRLEKTVLSFFLLTGIEPASFEDFLQKLIPEEDFQTVMCCPWYRKPDTEIWPLQWTMEKIIPVTEVLSDAMRNSSAELMEISGRVIPAKEFNNHLRKGNKAVACQSILSPLIQKGLKLCQELTIDRQGGRKFYGEWLLEVFPGKAIGILQETALESSYRIPSGTLKFITKADSLSFETALSSLFSKYIREVLMSRFNHYWQETVPGIKSTAGYPQDAKRFIEILRKNKKIPKSETDLIRRR